MNTQELEERVIYQEQDVDIKITALLRVLEKQTPEIWKLYRDELDHEYLKRNISPPEFVLGYYVKP